MNEFRRIATLVFAGALVAGCARREFDAKADTPVIMAAIQPALASVTEGDILRRASALAADSMEGRLPGTVGEERAVRYIEGQFRSLGLAPGNPDSTYEQKVPLVGITPEVTASFTIKGRSIPIQGGRDYIAESTRVTPEVKVEDSELVFVGYGAIDNASGVATVLEIAEAFTKLPERPNRSILFIAVTAEEQGLLGAKYEAVPTVVEGS